MKVGEKVKILRKEARLTQEDLAKKLNIAPTTVSSWERNANKPLMDKIVVMAEMFNVPITHFFDLEEFQTKDEVMLPVYGKIACGNGLVVYETPTEYEATPKDWITGGEFFYLKAEGDSMVGARINEGDLLLIRKQEEVENGEIAAVVIEDVMVLKRVYKTNGHLTLISENPGHPPRIFNPTTDENIRIIGKLKKMVVNF